MFFFRSDRQLLEDIIKEVKYLRKQGDRGMAIGKDILDAVTNESTVVDSFLTLAQGLIDNNTVSPAEGAAIIAAINAERDKVQAAILANTTPVVEPIPDPEAV